MAAVPRASALDIPAQVAALSAGDFETRARAVRELSAAKSPGEAAEIMERFNRVLACSGKKPAASGCHDPKFVYNALLVAGNLARKDTGAPWAFLIGLSQGKTVNEGSFFQAKDESDEHRGDDYYTPSAPDPKLTREYLEATLQRAVDRAEILPSCGWTLARIKTLAKKVSDSGGYQVYSYSRDYSPADIAGQYRVSPSRDWLYKGTALVACGERTLTADLGAAGRYFAVIADRSDEQPLLDISLYSLPGGKPACAYTVQGLSELDPDPLTALPGAPAKYLPAVFDFSGGRCVPRKASGYDYTPLAAGVPSKD
ncbi:MAG: hypothetical protein A2X32_12810 [Elusimicrobia bacterium GWC2_64_44]|nr:MAG: hypothetical protein A2X32_12810 [Elusimicrobia bacterium GWC2_64_44]